MISRNNKVYLLGLLVMGIWGTIGYRIYQHLNDDGNVEYAAPFLVRPTVDSLPVTKVLALDYDDPFLKRKGIAVTSSDKQMKIRSLGLKKTETQDVQVNWNAIQYEGVVYNATRKVKTVSLVVNGNDYFLKEGEVRDGFKVLEIQPDSVKISYNSIIRFVKLIK